MKKQIWILVVVIVSLVTLLAFVWGVRGVYLSSLEPVTSATVEPQLVEVVKGTSTHQIARELETRGLIKNAWSFQWYLYKNGISNRIQAGLYRFSAQQSVAEMASMLGRGDTAVRSLTITGGMRLSMVREQLKNMGYSDAQIDEALGANYQYSVLADKPAGVSLEGYLYPDTYRVEEGSNAIGLVDLILSHTDKKITPEFRQAWSDQGLNIHQGLTLASMVQQEASDPEAQRQIAQAFLKRLQIGMKLESDVTFIYSAYLLGTTPSVSLDSPYNTYLVAGLPLGPIAAIEDSALQAVAHPANTDWLYFLADKEGNTHFSLDKAGHDQNIEKYLR